MLARMTPLISLSSFSVPTAAAAQLMQRGTAVNAPYQMQGRSQTRRTPSHGFLISPEHHFCLRQQAVKAAAAVVKCGASRTRKPWIMQSHRRRWVNQLTVLAFYLEGRISGYKAAIAVQVLKVKKTLIMLVLLSLETAQATAINALLCTLDRPISDATRSVQ